MLFRKTLLSLSSMLVSLSVGVMSTIAESGAESGGGGSVNLKVFTPASGDLSGIKSQAVMVDLAARFKGNLASTRASPELTGPGTHGNTAPFPGTFGLGANDHFPGLVVLLSSTKIGAGPGQNVSNLFEITTVTNQSKDETEIWSTWIVGAPSAFGTVGRRTPSRLFVAVVEGKAPDVVQDIDRNGVLNQQDLERMGVKVSPTLKKLTFL